MEVPRPPKITYTGHRLAVRDVFNEPSLLVHILTDVYTNSSISEFVACLHVCPAFYYVSLPLFEEAITLRERSLESFIECNKARRITVFITQILTVRLEPGEPSISNPTGFWTKNINPLLISLAKIIQEDMPFIKSFSFHVGDQQLEGWDQDPDQFRYRPGFRADSAMALLQALPLGCKDLEVDTSGFEYYRGRDHFCPYIARLMPYLHHVRIRIGQICPTFCGVRSTDQCRCKGYPENTLPPFAPFLRSLVVNTELSSMVSGGIRSCTQSSNAPIRPLFYLEDLPEILRICYMEKNFFPELERLDIYSPLELSLPRVGAIRQVDIKNLLTHIQPYVPLPSRELDARRPISWRCIRSKFKGDIIAPFAWAREALEDSWRATTGGTRFPICPESGDIPVDLFIFEPTWEAIRYNHGISSFIRRQKRKRSTNDAGGRLLHGTDLDFLKCVTYRTLQAIPDHYLPDSLRDIRSSIE